MFKRLFLTAGILAAATFGAQAFFFTPAVPPPITCSVAPAVHTFATAGSISFTVPCYNSITIEIWGGGGGGGNAVGGGTNATDGGTTSADVMTATGGGHGNVISGGGGPGGVGSGGGTNGTGTSGLNTNTTAFSNAGGAAATCLSAGGAGGASNSVSGTGLPGSPPGGGGAGEWVSSHFAGPSAGGAGCSAIVYSKPHFSVGSSITGTVGAGGTAGTDVDGVGGAGAVGTIKITVS